MSLLLYVLKVSLENGDSLNRLAIDDLLGVIVRVKEGGEKRYLRCRGLLLAKNECKCTRKSTESMEIEEETGRQE